MGKMKKKILYHGVHISIGALVLLTFALAFPMVSENSFAEPITLADNEVALVTTDIDVKSAISLATKQQLAFEINPHSSGSAFGKGTTTINVVTNTDAGYNLYIHTTSENGQLHNKREGVTDVLEPMAKAAAPDSADFANNTWGYSLDGTTYQAVPTTSTKVPGSEASAASTTYNVNIGAKIGMNLAAGNYQGTVIFSTVANPIIVEEKGTWDTIKTMQEMTPEICASAPVWKSAADTRVLLDDRGPTPRKQYNVAKLKDNNCWMQENLALNGGFTLTPADSDVAANWAMPATSTSSGGMSSSNTNIESRHPNNYWYYSWSTATVGSGTAMIMDGQVAPDSICPKGWQLPLSGSNYNTITNSGNPTNKIGSGSYYDLLMSYGITTQTQMINSGEVLPLNFVRAGYIDVSGLGQVGIIGTYWSSVAASSDTSAYDLFYRSVDMTISHSTARLHGFSVRCVARQVAR